MTATILTKPKAMLRFNPRITEAQKKKLLAVAKKHKLESAAEAVRFIIDAYKLK